MAIDTAHTPISAKQETDRMVEVRNLKMYFPVRRGLIVEWRQDLKNPADLVYGRSITDACLCWDTSAPLFHELAASVRERRRLAAAE